MLISRKSLSLLIENFLKEEEEKKESEKEKQPKEEVVLQDLEVEHDGVTAEIRVRGDRHDVYINGVKTEELKKLLLSPKRTRILSLTWQTAA